MDKKEMPALTTEQRLGALAKGAEYRKRRSQAKNDFAEGKIGYTAIFESEDEAIQRMKVTELIGCVRGVGETKTKRLMATLGIAESRRVKGLGASQKQKLGEWFDTKGMKA